ncbi:Dihydrolipoamide dehydrogenase of pyruvate dehydrogenase complex (EC [Olavius algarvensis Delta 1 endosymbiont]|nr:Dihydrolipoamide dehydrogenase of pyruvate dehydrogenase complex (EC [Olavius algarvensis Delta 1 endosymbiont]
MVMGELTQETELLVIGNGPGGYAAAFRAADLGMDVTMVDTAQRPGGVCLFKGCIPSKTLLYLAELIYDADKAASMGISFGKPQVDLAGLRDWKASVIDKMANGLISLSERRGVQLISGRAEFESSDMVRLYDSEVSRIKFRHAVLATGSRPIPLPGADFSPDGRIMSSTGALALADIPDKFLVVGGGYVGLELGTVYAALGSKVTLVEFMDRLLPGVDRDLVQPLNKKLKGIFERIHLNTKVTSLAETDRGVDVTLEGDIDNPQQTFDRVLVAIGRRPASQGIGLENTKVNLDDKGFVVVDARLRTSDEKIFAVGDVAGGMMLAHKATREGKIAVEVIAGEPSAFDVRAIPAVVYTDPQIAWCGLTEEEARREGRPVNVQRFPWKFSGRATTMGAPEGLTKILVDPESGRILGVGIAGRDTEGLISEGVLAVEMGALAEDMALSIHPHPTLSETEGEAAELFLGTATHILNK